MKLVAWAFFSFLKAMLFPVRSRRQLQVLQERGIAKVLSRLKHYRFYSGLDVNEWCDLPIVDKQIHVQNFARVNAFGIERTDALEFGAAQEKSKGYKDKMDGITVGLSTGTSGQRGVFLLSDAEIGRWCGTILAKALGWKVFKKQRVAFVFRTNSPLYESLNLGWIRFRHFDIHRDVALTAQGLLEFQPTILISTPLFLSAYLKARPQREISPRTVFSVADVLSPVESAKLQLYFGLPVRQIYQATEGFLGISCEHGRLHLNEELYLFEKKSLAGGRFSPVLTDFSRTTQAFFRYHLDDVLVPGEESCPCGQPTMVIKEILGRNDEVLVFESQDGLRRRTVFPDLIREVMAAEACYDLHYQVRQTGPSVIEVALDRAPGPKTAEGLKSAFARVFGRLDLNFIEVQVCDEALAAHNLVKRRRVLKSGPPL